MQLAGAIDPCLAKAALKRPWPAKMVAVIRIPLGRRDSHEARCPAGMHHFEMHAP